jgi:hypothetical protein
VKRRVFHELAAKGGKMYQDRKTREKRTIRTGCLICLVLLFAVAANAQLVIGDNLNMKMDGNLGFGYSGSFGNSDFQSNHGHGFMANGTMTGFYYHPNFISFEFRPYYDRAQTNSDSQTITRGTGVGASMSFFGGSRFPGSISYGKDFSTGSEFRFAGVPSVLGDSSGRNFSVMWSALVPKLPQVRASYFSSASESSVVGIENDSKNSSANFSVYSDYTLAGFDLRANFTNIRSSFTAPSFLTADVLESSGTSTSYGLTAQHKLPLSGNLGLGWNHSDYSSDVGSDFGTTSYSAGAGITPWRPLSVYSNVNYTTNLAAAFSQSVINGVATPGLISDNTSNSLLFSTGATWSIGRGFTVNGHFNQRLQNFAGREYSDSQYGGTLTYNFATRLFGLLYFGVGAIDTADKNGNNGAGLIANVGMSKKFGKWDTSADFNYAQNVQTMVSIATTSSFNYGGTVRRKVTQDLRFSAGFRSSQTGMVQQEGSGNIARNFNGSVSYKRHSLSGNYAQSNGTAIFNVYGGLTATPVGSLITQDFLLFNARSYGITASTLLYRRVALLGGYAKFNSDTTSSTANRLNNGDRYTLRTEYKLRKFAIIGGFTRSQQDVSTIPGGPRVVNSYYLSLSRWFNIF